MLQRGVEEKLKILFFSPEAFKCCSQFFVWNIPVVLGQPSLVEYRIEENGCGLFQAVDLFLGQTSILALPPVVNVEQEMHEFMVDTGDASFFTPLSQNDEEKVLLDVVRCSMEGCDENRDVVRGEFLSDERLQVFLNLIDADRIL